MLTEREANGTVKKSFWDRTAFLYDGFMRKDFAAYEKMYALIRPAIKEKDVLELATGTGAVAKNTADFARSFVATDMSEEMIEQAKKNFSGKNIAFSVCDMFSLPYADGTFDAVIVSNALHIVPYPEKALAEIWRVLKSDGVLIAPTFTHAENSVKGKMKAFFMKTVGFPLHSKWSCRQYLDFLENNGWTVRKYEALKASFPLTYVECIKR